MASSISPASNEKNPPICSLVSAYGPSVIITFPFRRRNVLVLRTVWRASPPNRAVIAKYIVVSQAFVHKVFLIGCGHCCPRFLVEIAKTNVSHNFSKMFGSTDSSSLESRETAAIPRLHEPLYTSRMKDGEIDNAKVVFLMSICQCAVLSWPDRLRPIHSRRAVREALLSHRWRHRCFIMSKPANLHCARYP